MRRLTTWVINRDWPDWIVLFVPIYYALFIILYPIFRSIHVLRGWYCMVGHDGYWEPLQDGWFCCSRCNKYWRREHWDWS